MKSIRDEWPGNWRRQREHVARNYEECLKPEGDTGPISDSLDWSVSPDDNAFFFFHWDIFFNSPVSSGGNARRGSIGTVTSFPVERPILAQDTQELLVFA